MDVSLPAWDFNVPPLLTLDRIGPDHFRSRFAQSNYQAAIYGGQLIGQAMQAAVATQSAGRIWSLHGYFLNAGNRNQPIDFRVERLRDSRQSATRRVVARQGDLSLFEMLCHMRAGRKLYEHDIAPPVVPAPETLRSLDAIARDEPDLLGDFGRFLQNGSALEIRPVSRDCLIHNPPVRHVAYWVRVPSAAGCDDPALHRAMIAYLSDYWFARISLIPHRSPMPESSMHLASIDHAMWFHRDARADQWLLYSVEAPFSGGGTGHVRGQIFDREGRLVVSCVQDAIQAIPR